ncbi:ATP-binding protein [Streptomyces boncukensis]|uniref:ATP-binding protein n=1 Tax=Streptomyces boncukensis TaxID=2711219 RepID=A0A6G4WQS8_9ACTN|nr:ATP-binding protein [Streptomyces boncukensis]NGO67555.1 ATP-binding protein [Streptomyces boncukensis]
MSSLWWSLRLRREAASVPLARRLLLGAMEAAGADPDTSYELSLALSEACANAVEHGRGAYCVTAYLDGDRCRIEVADSGPGFPADADAEGCGDAAPGECHEAESGRGLFLIEALADHVRFRNRPDSGGAVVSFDKVLRRGVPDGVPDGLALPSAS